MAASGDRAASLVDLLDAIVRGCPDALLVDPPPASDPDPTWRGALETVALVVALRWDDALARALATPPAAPGDAEGRWLRAAATAWAGSGDPAPGSDAVLAALDDADLPDPSCPLGRFAGYLLVEAALAHARLDLAHEVEERLGPALWEPLVLAGGVHPFHRMMLACRIRLLAFRGHIAEADAVRRTLAPLPGSGSGSGTCPVVALSAATACLVRGNDADPADVRRLAAEVDRHVPEPTHLLAVGSQMLVAFGLIAVGEVAEAARRVLVAGHGPDLDALNVVDRALGLELLTTLALAAGDLDAAEAWRDRAAPLVASPIADSTVARIHSRVALGRGDVDEAVAWGERAVARAREVGRAIEYAEGEIVLSRARIDQRGPGGRAAAAAALETMVAEAEALGHRAARRSAARELRPIGLRLRPHSGSGWSGLTDREAEVARLVARGAANREIAGLLHVSEHTVRAHVSRVLAAFGVASRVALPAALDHAAATPQRSEEPLDHGPALPALTSRQQAVAALVAEGLSNAAIAVRLEVSPRTVEKHVGDILTRWDLPSRTSIAHAVTSGGYRTA